MANKEWPNITLHSYNESEIELHWMKWLILDRIRVATLMSSEMPGVGSIVQPFLWEETIGFSDQKV